MKIYRWKKKPGTGGHSFKRSGLRVRAVPGDEVEATMAELGKFSDEYACLGEVTDSGIVAADPVSEQQAEEDEAKKIPTGLEIVGKGGGWYDVINPDNPDKPLNDKAMRKKEAENLLNWLMEDE